MTDDSFTQLGQDCETPVTTQQRRVFGYRYAYSRSADSRAQQDKGQDYLAFREDGQRMAFALCDGVSQSFYGDLAAHLLGDALVNWMWERNTANTEIVQIDMESFLDSLVRLASEKVETYPISEDLAEMIRQVLEQKRAVGSESTFVTGLLDFNAGQLSLAWMGDSRLRLWGKVDEITNRLGDAFHTQERWSTRRGRIGDLHTFTMPLKDLYYLIAYSDGLARLDKILARHFRDVSMDTIIEDALLRPESDDISFLEVWSGGQHPVERPPLSAPPDTKLDVEEGRVRFHWRPVAGAAFYEARLADGQSFIVYAPGRSLDIPKEALKADTRTVCVRAWEDEPGKWSDKVSIPQQLLQPAALAVQPPIPAVPPGPLPVVPTPARFPVTYVPPAVPPRPTSPPSSYARARPSRLMPYIYGGLIVLLVGVLAFLLLLFWPGSPLRAMLLPSSSSIPLPTHIPDTSSLVPIIETAAPTEILPSTTPSSSNTLTPLPVATQTPIILTFCVNVEPGARIRTAPGVSNPELVANKRLEFGKCLFFDMYALDDEQKEWLRIAPNQLGYEDLAGGWVYSGLLSPATGNESWMTVLPPVTLTPTPSLTLMPTGSPSPNP